jgi:hypothetical protein
MALGNQMASNCRALRVSWNSSTRAGRSLTPAAVGAALGCGALLPRLAARRGVMIAVVRTREAAAAALARNAQIFPELGGQRVFVESADAGGAGDDADDELLLRRALEAELAARPRPEPARPREARRDAWAPLRGLLLVLDFVSEEDEAALLAAADDAQWAPQLVRRVQHLGAAFDYVRRAPVADGGGDATGDGGAAAATTPPIASNAPLAAVAAELARLGLLGDAGDARIAGLCLGAPVRGKGALAELLPGGRGGGGGVNVAVDQVTLNEYVAGRGISPHVDTHAGFEDGIVSLSLGADIVMELAPKSEECAGNNAGGDTGDADEVGVGNDNVVADATRHIVLPRRSLLVLRGEARFAWTHGIAARKTDFIDGKVVARGRRVSATFRVVRRAGRPCRCPWPSQCFDQEGGPSEPDKIYSPRLSPSAPAPAAPSPARPAAGGSTRGVAVVAEAADAAGAAAPARAQAATPDLERLHVHALYDVIAEHFSDTRHSRWPRVEAYVRALPRGALLVDAGCGNGKYLGARALGRELWALGADRSAPLAAICGARGHEALVADALALPLRAGLADCVACIAVLHHVSTRARRVRLVRELLRAAAREGGHVLVYAWAQEQGAGSRRAFASQDVLVPWCLQRRYADDGASAGSGAGTGVAMGAGAGAGDTGPAVLPSDQAQARASPQAGQPAPPAQAQPARRLKDDEVAAAGGVIDTARNVVVFQRYCHVFIAGELQALAREAAAAEGLAYVEGGGADGSQGDEACAAAAPAAAAEPELAPAVAMAGRRGDEGVIATPQLVPDSTVAPVRALADCADEADPITARVAALGASCGAWLRGAGAPRVRLLASWWERDNWCVLLRREG